MISFIITQRDVKNIHCVRLLYMKSLFFQSYISKASVKAAKNTVSVFYHSTPLLSVFVIYFAGMG